MSAVRLLVAVTAVLLLAMLATGTACRLAMGLPRAAGYVLRFWPLDWAAFAAVWHPAVDTLTMSLFGTTLAFCSALPLAFLASRNLAANAAVYVLSRLAATVLRASPVVVLGVLFVAAVGLGPTAGIMGLWFHTTGVFVKYLSEQFEAGGRDILGAALVDGATRWQAYLYVLLPAEANAALSFLLYYYEANFRQATFLSMVGAGGIGIELSAAVGRFDYGRTGLIVLTVIAVSVALDFTSRLLRARLT